MQTSYNVLSSLLTCMLLFATMIATVTYGLAQSLNDCKEIRDEAEQKIFRGDFENAIVLLNRCLESKDTKEKDIVEAHKLLAKIFIGQVDTVKAVEIFYTMLELDPHAVLDPKIETREVMHFFNKAKKRYELEENPSIFRNKWFLIGGGGGLAAGIVAAIMRGGGSEDPGNFPLPPRPR